MVCLKAKNLDPMAKKILRGQIKRKISPIFRNDGNGTQLETPLYRLEICDVFLQHPRLYHLDLTDRHQMPDANKETATAAATLQNATSSSNGKFCLICTQRVDGQVLAGERSRNRV